MEDVFDVQDEIARTIAQRLTLSLASNRGGQAMQPPTRHLGAYELYLKGRALLYQRGLSILKAIDCFTEAVTLDPTYAQAWPVSPTDIPLRVIPASRPRWTSCRARSRPRGGRSTWIPDFPKGIARWRARRSCSSVTTRWPNASSSARWRSTPDTRRLLRGTGCFVSSGSAEAFARDAMRSRASSSSMDFPGTRTSFSHARNSPAVACRRRGPRAARNRARSQLYLGHWALMESLQWAGHLEESALVADRALAISGRIRGRWRTWSPSTPTMGKTEEARAVYREMEIRSAREYVQPSMLAPAAAAVGDMDQAVAIAQRALDERDPLFVLLARTWPGYSGFVTIRDSSTSSGSCGSRTANRSAAPAVFSLPRSCYRGLRRHETVARARLPLSAAAAAALAPLPARAQQTAPLGGVWSLNRSLSEFPADIGFNPAWMTGATREGGPGTVRTAADADVEDPRAAAAAVTRDRPFPPGRRITKTPGESSC